MEEKAEGVQGKNVDPAPLFRGQSVKGCKHFAGEVAGGYATLTLLTPPNI